MNYLKVKCIKMYTHINTTDVYYVNEIRDNKISLYTKSGWHKLSSFKLLNGNDVPNNNVKFNMFNVSDFDKTKLVCCIDDRENEFLKKGKIYEATKFIPNDNLNYDPHLLIIKCSIIIPYKSSNIVTVNITTKQSYFRTLNLSDIRAYKLRNF